MKNWFWFRVFICGKGIEFENEFGDLYEAYYASLESVYIEVTEKLKKNKQLAEKLKPHLKKLLKMLLMIGGIKIRLVIIFRYYMMNFEFYQKSVRKATTQNR